MQAVSSQRQVSASRATRLDLRIDAGVLPLPVEDNVSMLGPVSSVSPSPSGRAVHPRNAAIVSAASMRGAGRSALTIGGDFGEQ